MPSAKASSPTYQLTITLMEIDPRIWRRIQVPSSIKLCYLHSAFQVVMGWTDSHFHQFKKGGKDYGVPEHAPTLEQAPGVCSFDPRRTGGIQLRNALAPPGRRTIPLQAERRACM